MGSFCSSKPQVTTYTPPAAVTKGYDELLSFAKPLLQKPYEAYQGPLVAGLSPYEQAAGQGIAGLFGGTEPYFNTAAGMAMQGSQPIQQMQFSPQAVQQYMSPYLQNVMGTTAQNIMETNAQQQNQLTGNAIQRGAFGGDRARVAQAELARQQNLANNATLANIANQGYSQALGMFNQQQNVDLQRQLQSGQLAQSGAGLLAQMGPAQQQAQLAQLGAQLGYGGLERQLGQAGLSTAYQQFLNQQQYPYNLANWFGGLMSGAASSLGGTTTTTAAQPSMFNQLLGFGGALGAMGGSGGIGGLGSSLMGGLAAIGFPVSDERLKENIQQVGKTNDGQNIYSYNLKGQDPSQTQLGLMAQEVEHVKPEAVHDFGGIKTVDYQAATKEAAIPHMADGGVPGVLGMSPIAGMQAQSYVPAPMQSQGGFKPPQQPQMAKDDSLDSMVKNIKSMMGTKPAQPQAAAPRQLGPQAPVGVEPVGTDTTNTTPEGTADLSNLYAAGGTVNPFNFDYGMQTKEDLAQQAQSRAGAGMSGLTPQEEAEAASGILGAAHGGRIHLADGGPAETDVERQPLDLTKPVPQAPRQSDFLSYITPRESGGDANARNPKSSASGLYQFTDATYRGVLARNPELEGASKNDPRVAEAHRKELARVLQSQGIEPNNQNLYMSWFLGAGGGPRFIKGMQENPNGPATALAQPDQVAANRNVFFNRDGSPRTASEVFNFLNRPMGGQGAAGAAPQAPQGVQQAQAPAQTTRVPASPDEARIPIQSRATKEGLFGMLGIAMTPEQRLAFIQASLKFAGTPGRPGVGLAAAADTYARTLLDAQKSQREAASTQAGTEQTRAAAKKEEQGAVAGQFIPGPGGYARFTATPEGGVKIEVPKMPAAGGETIVPGPGGAAPTTAPGAPTAPQAPTATGAPAPGGAQTETEKRVFNFAPLHGGETAQQKLDVMRKMGEEISQKAWGTNGPQLQKEYAEINGEAQREGKAATNSLNDLAALSKAISGLPASGPLTPGAASELRYQVANYINTFAKSFGVDAGVNGAMSSKEMLDKLGTLSTQKEQRGLGREAAVWLQTLSKAYPSAGMTAETARSLTADLIVANKRNMDRAQIYSLYGDYSNNAGRNAEDVFRAVVPQERYLQDKQAIEKILALRSPQGNPLTMLQNGQIKREAFDAYAKKYFGIDNLSRYAFGG